MRMLRCLSFTAALISFPLWLRAEPLGPSPPCSEIAKGMWCSSRRNRARAA